MQLSLLLIVKGRGYKSLQLLTPTTAGERRRFFCEIRNGYEIHDLRIRLGMESPTIAEEAPTMPQDELKPPESKVARIENVS